MELTTDEQKLIMKIREASKQGFATLEIDFQNGKPIYAKITTKEKLN